MVKLCTFAPFEMFHQQPPSFLIFLLMSHVCHCFAPACWPEHFGGVPAAGPGWQPWKRAGERRFMCCTAGFDQKEQDLFVPAFQRSFRGESPCSARCLRCSKEEEYDRVLKGFLPVGGRECLEREWSQSHLIVTKTAGLEKGPFLLLASKAGVQGCS